MPAGGISIHAVDARNGLAAAGLRVDVLRRTGAQLTLIATGRIGSDALLRDPRLESRQRKGSYEAHFHAGDYFEERRCGDPLPPLLDVVAFAFEIVDPAQHLHLPLKMTPVGYCLFRGDP